MNNTTDILEQLKRCVEDPIMFSLFDNPNTIECNHTFSKSVLDTILSKLKEGEKAECPICRKIFTKA